MADIRRLRTTLAALKSARTNLESTWDEIEINVMPLTGRTNDVRTDGKTEIQCWDSTAPLANEHLAAALAGAVVPAGSRWYGMDFNDPDLRKEQEALAYLEKLTEMTWSEIRNSDFAMQIGSGLLEYTGIGNIVLVVEPTSETEWDGLDFSCVPCRQAHFLEDSRGGVAEFYRALKWTPVQIKDRCDESPVPEKITRAIAAGGDQAITPLDVTFAIFEREDMEKPGRDDKGKSLPLAPERRPYGYVYFLTETGEQLGEEGGYYEMPAVVGRWAISPGQQWGFGRGNQALRPAKYLNAYLESQRAAAEKVVDPSTMVTERGLLSDLNLQPGGLTVARSKEDAWVHESGARFDVSAEVIRDTRMEIRRIFHEDDLELKESPAMTATEVQARRDLMNRNLGAPVGRLQSDVLSPLIRIVLGHLDRAGKLPPVPAIVKQKKAEVAISFYGAISRAQRVDEVASIERLFAFGASLVKSDPDHFGAAADVLDPVAAIREAALRLGTPAMVLKSEKVVKQEQEAKARMLLAQQQAELAKMQAGAAKDAAGALATMPAAPPDNLLGGAGLTMQPQPSLMPQTGLPPGCDVRTLLVALLLSQTPPTIRLLDEGSTKGYVNSLDCRGTGVTCSAASREGTITITGGTPDLTIPTYTRAGAPACSSTWLSKEIRVHDAGQEDQTWICELDSAAAYQWAVYSQAPSVLTGTSRFLPDGTEVVTVGAVLQEAGGSWSVNATGSLGSAISTIKTVAPSQYQAIFVAVGATIPFTSVTFAGGGGRATRSSMLTCPNGTKWANGGALVTTGGSTTVPAASELLANNMPGYWPGAKSMGGACTDLTVTYAGTAAFGSHTLSNWAGSPAPYANAAFSWDLWNQGGTITMTGFPARSKGWEVTCGGAGAAPTRAAEFYWVTFSIIEYAPQCDPGLTNCYDCSGTPATFVGDFYSPFTVVATGVSL